MGSTSGSESGSSRARALRPRSNRSGSRAWEGLEHTHGWSRGVRCGSWMRGEVSARLRGLGWSSLLRPYWGLAIARAFARLDGYDEAFTSCNAVFRRDPARRGAGWCCDCPKCRFVFLVLAPWMEPERLERIFGHNLLDDPAQVEGFSELMAVGAPKPF